MTEIYSEWNAIPAGVFIAILGFLAAATAFFEVPKTGWKRALWTSLFFALMFSEILILRRDQQLGDTRHRELVEKEESNANMEQDHFAKLLQIERDTGAIIQGYMNSEKIAAQAELARAQHHKASDELMELKARAATLSLNIFRLLFNRSSMSPPIPRSATWDQDIAKLYPFDHETVLLYEQQYGADTRRIVKDLSEHGLKIDVLELLAPNPVNITGIRDIAAYLASASESITPDGIKPMPLLVPY